MSIIGPGYEILGVSVFGGGPLACGVHLELGPGVTALYGLNGAGKTWLLRGLGSALTGVKVESDGHLAAELHIRITDPQASLANSGPLDSLRDAILEHLDLARGELGTIYNLDDGQLTDRDPLVDELMYRAAPNSLWDTTAAVIDASDFAESADKGFPEAAIRERTSLLYAASYGGYYTLRATGSTARPTWHVSLSAPMSIAGTEGAGELAETLRRARHESELLLTECINDAPIVALSQMLIKIESAVKPFHLVRMEAGNYMLPLSDTVNGHEAPPLPGWVPIPLLTLTEELTTPLLTVLGSDELPVDLHRETRESLLAARPTVINPTDFTREVTDGWLTYDQGMLVLHPDIEGRLRELEQSANRNLQDVLVDARLLRYWLGTPENWLAGENPEWMGVLDSGALLSLEALSAAQQRWAQTAIGLALGGAGRGQPVVFLCDEPERGLHRSAERQLARGLSELCSRTGVAMAVATHSPFLLDSAQAHPVLVHRVGGRSQTSPVPISLIDRDAMEMTGHQLGLTVGDLLPLMRTALIVEGLHDEIVFSTLLTEPIDRALAGVMPLHGARRTASVPDARLLMDATACRVLVVLDNMTHDWVSGIWDEARAAAEAGEYSRAAKMFDRLKSSKGDEGPFLHSMARRALDTAQLDRIDVHGLRLPDVICYLTEDDILDSAGHSWDDLISSWTSTSDRPRNIKRWLQLKKLLPDDELEINRRVADAASGMRRSGQPLPADLAMLSEHILRLRAPLGTPHPEEQKGPGEGP